MFEKNLHVAFLLDFYGEVLGERTRELLEMYYCDDMSLSEIADAVGITRQGVRGGIKKGEETLRSLEETLGLATRYSEITENAKRILSLAVDLKARAEDEEARASLDGIIRSADAILKKEED